MSRKVIVIDVPFTKMCIKLSSVRILEFPEDKYMEFVQRLEDAIWDNSDKSQMFNDFGFPFKKLSPSPSHEKELFIKFIRGSVAYVMMVLQPYYKAKRTDLPSDIQDIISRKKYVEFFIEHHDDFEE